jgi:uncharacterized coiled-coil protein SlyX
MVESLGVAGSVVGIISLSIQISQGLLKFYRSWKDQDSVVSDICVSLESLSETLTIMLTAIQPPAKYDKIVKNNVEENIDRMSGTLKKLEYELKKIQGTETPKPGARATMRHHIRRAFYPFKEETLNQLQRAVAEARSNLDLALQMLQMFVYECCYIRIWLI